MSVKLPFYNEGQSFQPRVLLSDVRKVEEAEAAAKKTDQKLHGTVQAHLVFLQDVLGRHAKQERLQLDLTVREIQEAFFAIWNDAFEPAAAAEADPLA